jgi:hypothetical protein
LTITNGRETGGKRGFIGEQINLSGASLVILNCYPLAETIKGIFIRNLFYLYPIGARMGKLGIAKKVL